MLEKTSLYVSIVCLLGLALVACHRSATRDTVEKRPESTEPDLEPQWRAPREVLAALPTIEIVGEWRSETDIDGLPVRNLYMPGSTMWVGRVRDSQGCAPDPAFMHDGGAVHRDLQPAYLAFAGTEGTVVVEVSGRVLFWWIPTDADCAQRLQGHLLRSIDLMTEAYPFSEMNAASSLSELVGDVRRREFRRADVRA